MKYTYSLIIRLITPFIISYELLNIIITPLTKYTSYLILKLLQQSPILIGNYLTIKEVTVKFIPACAAVSAYFLLLLLIITTKDIKFYTRIKIGLLGSLSIFLFNIIRVTILLLLFAYFSLDVFKTVHMVFWSIVVSIYVAFTWIFLTRYYKIKSIPIYSDFIYLLKEINLYKSKRPKAKRNENNDRYRPG